MQKKGKSSDFRRLTSLLNLLIIVPIRTPPWKPHIKLATSNHKAKTEAALWGNVVLSNTICVAYLYGDKPIPVGLLPQQYTKQFDLCQGTPNPHRCEMVGGFYRCTLKIEDAVPVEVFTSVLWSASKAAGMQQTPPSSTTLIGRNLPAGMLGRGKAGEHPLPGTLYKHAFF